MKKYFIIINSDKNRLYYSKELGLQNSEYYSLILFSSLSGWTRTLKINELRGIIPEYLFESTKKR